MTLLAQLFALTTMLLFSATFFAVWRIDRMQQSALWFGLFFALGTGAMCAHQALFTLSGGQYPDGFDGATANLLFIAALAAFGRAVPTLFRVRRYPALTVALPLAVLIGQMTATAMGDMQLRGWIMGGGALVGLTAPAVLARGRAATATERVALWSIGLGGLSYVAAPAYYALDPAGDVIPTAALRAQVVTSSFIGLFVAAALLAVHAQRIHRRLINASERDPLTGLLNRRGLETVVATRRSNEPWSVVMIDLDHFKAVNDRFGHAAGDAVLRAAATVLRGCVRLGDAVARAGGEEFVLVLPNATAEDARVAAERARVALGAVAHPELGGRSVTASLGVAAWPFERSLAAAVDEADGALYAAKREGRNRTVVAPQGGPTPPARERAAAGRVAEGRAAEGPAPSGAVPA